MQSEGGKDRESLKTTGKYKQKNSRLQMKQKHHKYCAQPGTMTQLYASCYNCFSAGAWLDDCVYSFIYVNAN